MRLSAPALTTALVALLTQWPAHAPAGYATAPSGTDVCVIDDPRATEISGLVATASGYVAINDSQFESDAMRVIHLDSECKVTSTLQYPSPARDPEDLAVAPDGTFWVADIGDNANAQQRRETVALWLIPSDGSGPVIHRLTYPDGPHDAEALLFAGDGTPIIITKETTGVAGLYRPTGPLRSRTTAAVPMQRVGEFRPVSHGENNNLGMLGEVLVTGAAAAPDRSRIVVRTYTGAYEWDLPDGDVVKAITTGIPRLTGLPDEPQGEAIAYTADGTAFVTVSDEVGPATIRRYEPSTVALQTPPPSASPTPAAASPPAGLSGTPLWLTLAAGGLGLVIAAAGFLGLRRSRARVEMPSA